jgi:hypothetical protein
MEPFIHHNNIIWKFVGLRGVSSLHRHLHMQIRLGPLRHSQVPLFPEESSINNFSCISFFSFLFIQLALSIDLNRIF